MSVNTIKVGSAIPEFIEIDDIAEEIFDLPKPDKILIVEGETDVIVLENYLDLKKISINFLIRTASMVDDEHRSGKDVALEYYDKHKDDREIVLLLDRDYDFICSTERNDERIIYYDYYSLENYFFEEVVMKYSLMSNGVPKSQRDKILDFMNSDKQEILNPLIECSKLRIFRKYHKDKKTSFQLNDEKIVEFADFIKNIDIKGCIHGQNPNLTGSSFEDRLQIYINKSLDDIEPELYQQIQNFLTRIEIPYPNTLIEYFKNFFNGKDSLKFIVELLLNENLLSSRIGRISSKETLGSYIFNSDLYQAKIQTVINRFST